MLIVAVLNLILDMTTVLTLSYLEHIPTIVNVFCHVVFYWTLDVFFYLFFSYMITIIYDTKVSETWKKMVGAIPMVVSMILAAVCPITFFQEGKDIYSLSVGVYATYAAIVIYMIVTLYYNTHYWKQVNSKKRHAILIATLIIFGLGGIQLAFPQMLLSGTGVVLLMYCLFLALENPGDYLNADTDTMNSYAFHTTVRDMFMMEKNFTVLTILFDDWNEIVARFGPHYGKELIRTLSQYLKDVYGMPLYYPMTGCPTLIAERLGAESVASQLGAKLNTLGEINGVSVELKWHICLTDYPARGASVSEVERNINFFATHPFDEALIEQETEGTGIFQYDDKWEDILSRERTIEEILQKAILEDGIVMNYQPIYSTTGRGFHSAEALVRLKDNDTIGFISPEEFIPIAEKKGLIVDLSMMIFEKVCRFIRDGKLKEKGIEYVEINLSAVHCMDSRLVEQLTGLLNKYELKPEQLNLEITETTALSVDKSVSSNLNRLIQMGCGFSMDDYGTGYSNLVQIADLTFDLAKIDKSLVWGYFAEDSKKEKVILSSTVSMFKNLDMGIVAEGVETKEQAETLEKMGVEYLQGYYFSRPIPEEQLLEFLSKN